MDQTDVQKIKSDLTKLFEIGNEQVRAIIATQKETVKGGPKQKTEYMEWHAPQN